MKSFFKKLFTRCYKELLYIAVWSFSFGMEISCEHVSKFAYSLMFAMLTLMFITIITTKMEN